MRQNLDDILTQIVEEDARYPEDAYDFVLEALSFSQKKFKRSKHVNGQELLEGLKELLLKEFGPMTMTVLKHWGIKNTEDFGNIVFKLVEKNVLSKTEEDSRECFKNAYDFEAVFDKGYRHRLARKISRLR